MPGLQWKNTGKITSRSGEYLIIKYPTHYLSLFGPQSNRATIGKYQSASEARAACEAHYCEMGCKKNP